MINCRRIEFAPEKSAQRIDRFKLVFGAKLLNRILAFALYLLGAKRKTAAAVVNMPEDSLKTVLRAAQQDGFAALCDRRLSAPAAAPIRATPAAPGISLLLDEQFCVIDFGGMGSQLKIDRSHQVRLKTVLLSLHQSGLLTLDCVSQALGLGSARCRELSAKLVNEDVVMALVDKRQGQNKDYLVDKTVKAELIQHFAAQSIVGRSTSSRALAELLNEQSQLDLSERTVRWHMNKLGLDLIKKTLPELVEALKKTDK
jgi:hypothetical protein